MGTDQSCGIRGQILGIRAPLSVWCVILDPRGKDKEVEQGKTWIPLRFDIGMVC